MLRNHEFRVAPFSNTRRDSIYTTAVKLRRATYRDERCTQLSGLLCPADITRVTVPAERRLPSGLRRPLTDVLERRMTRSLRWVVTGLRRFVDHMVQGIRLVQRAAFRSLIRLRGALRFVFVSNRGSGRVQVQFYGS